MKEKADAWQMELTKISWEFDKLLEEYDLTTLNLKPGPGKWSPMEIIDHLIKVNASYFPIFNQIIDQKFKPPILGKLPFYGKKMGEQILSAMNKKARFKTFRPWEPMEKTHNNDLKVDFLDKQDQLSNYILKLEPYLDQKLMIYSPANKWIVYPLDTAIEIILSHEKRHLSQIKNQLNQD